MRRAQVSRYNDIQVHVKYAWFPKRTTNGVWCWLSTYYERVTPCKITEITFTGDKLSRNASRIETFVKTDWAAEQLSR